ncbi:aminopeptidase P family protein [Spirochaeta africana]|uniref:aminopeptidase P family protein n=1 Tax=Spirochaeta africana TaxID=46355 RepID=UPI00145E4A6C|nr:aminopeptidase P family protein [Spirochaeta africana]
MNKQAIQERLDGLRAAMREAGLAAWVVFSTDPHMSEYVPQRWQARAWLSGFDGSAGTLVVTAEAGAASGGTVGGRAALWTDGRYYLQADEQLADTGIELMREGEADTPDMAGFLADVLGGDAQAMRERVAVGTAADCVSLAQARGLAGRLAAAGMELVPGADLLDRVWRDRPGVPQGAVTAFPADAAGESRAERLAGFRAALGMGAGGAAAGAGAGAAGSARGDAGRGAGTVSQAGAAGGTARGTGGAAGAAKGAPIAAGSAASGARVDGALVASLDDLAYLLLLRGDDVAYNPVSVGYALIEQDRVRVYLPAGKHASAGFLLADGIELREYEDIAHDLGMLPDGYRLLIDPARTNTGLLRELGEGVQLRERALPSVAMKARKNPVEVARIREAMRIDGAAMVRFLRWITQHPAVETLDELGAARELQRLRAEHPQYRGDSFPAIAGFGPHGAVVHYSVTEESSLPFSRDGLFLIDSGAHYDCGTTDITRVVCWDLPGEATGEVPARDGEGSETASARQAAGGEVAAAPVADAPGVVGAAGAAGAAAGGFATDADPSAQGDRMRRQMRRDYTLVLKGHIALARARFPAGTRGLQLDTLARAPLWQHGLDYRHGTGHGVGYCLPVHEGPQSISTRFIDVALEPGMLSSNEPGLYRDGEYGIRLENLILTVASGEDNQPPAAAGGGFLEFETLTLCPFERRLIEVSLLSPDEIEWLDSYHARVERELAPLLDGADREYLTAACAPLKRGSE